MMIAAVDRLIPAPVDIVWNLISTSEGLLEWMAVEAEVDLNPGGAIRWTHENDAVVAGSVVEVVPMRRLVLTYGWESGGFPIEPGSTTVTIELESRGGATMVTVRHEGLDDEMAKAHTEGWTHFVGRLCERAEGDET
ncbi:MAG: SRPBCC domain-containing protein [Actinomycetia bacterium]|nr:SRPBCC domain-containing protein [Actinomycetes bacterium]MCP4963531.1 SRPBCC domain-containing protein [Actinomycetes bacterium]